MLEQLNQSSSSSSSQISDVPLNPQVASLPFYSLKVFHANGETFVIPLKPDSTITLSLQEDQLPAIQTDSGSVSSLNPILGKLNPSDVASLPLKFKNLYQVYGDQLNLLSQQHYDNIRLNIKLLRRFNGNVEKVLTFLKKNDDRQQHLEIARIQFSDQLDFLEQQGFSNPHLNLKLLIRFHGDLDNTILILMKKQVKQQKKQIKCAQQVKSLQETNLHHRSQGVCRCLDSKQSLFEQKQKFINQQLDQLEQQGFYQRKLNLIALKKTGGDLSLATEWLRVKKGSPALPAKFQRLNSQYKNQLEILNQQGFHNLHLNLIALRKFDGNPTAASNWLQIKRFKGKA